MDYYNQLQRQREAEAERSGQIARGAIRGTLWFLIAVLTLWAFWLAAATEVVGLSFVMLIATVLILLDGWLSKGVWANPDEPTK